MWGDFGTLRTSHCSCSYVKDIRIAGCWMVLPVISRRARRRLRGPTTRNIKPGEVFLRRSKSLAHALDDPPWIEVVADPFHLNAATACRAKRVFVRDSTDSGCPTPKNTALDAFRNTAMILNA
jgi:hypothetical protein